MKQVRRVGFATAWLCVTALLISAFIVLFSYSGYSSDDKSKENSSDKFEVAGSKTALK